MLLASGLVAQAATFTVTTTADSGAGSLRQAITDANVAAGADTITFAIPDAQKANGIWTIQLSRELPLIYDDVTFTGPGANLLTVRGYSTSSFIAFRTTTNITEIKTNFSGLTVSNAEWGIFSYGTTTLTHCTLSGNQYGIISADTATLTHCTLSGNAYGIETVGTATLTNCTFSGNNGTGIRTGGSANTTNVTNCTISGNYRGIYNFPEHKLTLRNTLLAGNTINIDNQFTDGGGNITSGTAAQAGLDPNGLQYNGGPTQTIALLIGSPAINAGDNALIPNGLTTDQRGTGFPRIVAGRVDIGAFESPQQSLVVTTTADEDNGNSDPTQGSGTSLREAMNYANGKAGADTITFAIPDAQKVSGMWTIQLSSALPAISDAVTLICPGANLLTVRGDGTGSFSAFTIDSGKTANFSGLTVSNAGYGIDNNNGTANVTNCTLSANNSTGITNFFGTATLTNCTLSGNPIGINSTGGTETLTNCTLSGNYYGILSDTGTEALTNCTLSGNSSGIFNSGGTATLTHCTLSGNTDGINNVAGATATLKNSLVAGNETNIKGGFTDGGNNITSGTAAQAGLDPNGLQNNGGPTKTIALVAGSSAIDAANDANAPATDQRGITRPQGAHSDIGAFEWEFTPEESLVVTTTADEDNGNSDPALGTGTSLREAINYANSKAGADTITFAIAEDQKANGLWTIQLGSALPEITDDLSLTGPGANLLTVLGGGTSSFDGFTIQTGKTASFSGLAVSNVRYGFSNGGTTTVTYCTLSGNNTGFNNTGTATLTHCALSGNTTGIFGNGTANVSNCTLSANSTGLTNFGTATLTNSTLSGNAASGIFNLGAVTLKNSVVAGNTINISGSITDGGNNITSGTAAQAGLDPSGLQDNGGPTKTIALVAGSPAIDMGNNAIVPAGVTTDQRGAGFPRIISGTVDIGAFEVQDATPVNQDPIAGPDTIMRYPSQGVNVPFATLLSNDTDPDGDTPLSITAFSSPTPGGGTVTTDGTLVYYTPAPGFTAADSFTYTLIDGHGGTATGVVTVEIIPDDGQSNKVTKIEMLPDGSMGLTFTGIPGSAYRIQSNDSLTPQNWRDRATVTADALGRFEFIDDDDPLPANRFYRSVFP